MEHIHNQTMFLDHDLDNQTSYGCVHLIFKTLKWYQINAAQNLKSMTSFLSRF